nr:MAG: glycoside hydrolase family 65 protein [Chloroflexota bacterium]
MSDGWTYVEERFDVTCAKGQEGLLTLGSGYLHVRGSFEEHLYDAPQAVTYLRKPANVTAEAFPEMKVKWGTFVPGIYGLHPLLGKEMTNLPWFLSLTPFVAGEKLDVERSAIATYRRTLDLKTATLRRELRWHTLAGAVIDVVFERFVSAARPHLCVQRLTMTSDRDVDVSLEAGIDADVRTSGYDHYTAVEFSRPAPDEIACSIRLDSGDEVHMRSWVAAAGVNWQETETDRQANLTATLRLRAGQPEVVEKRTAVTTSFDPVRQDLGTLLSCDHRYEALHAEHADIWATRWRQSDVVIEGDPEAQLRLRLGLYHLLRAHPNDSRLAIDPKAYAGDAYRGLFFWDTEIYMLPFFLYTQPERARSLLDFRINTLDGARANAASYGYAGARYPWEGDVDGVDQCPNWQYRDHEVHVTADVVYALAHYARATGDMAYLTGNAAPVLRETARYWLERVDWRPGDGYPSLLGVMGPDEYTPISSNNAYTNRLVAFALEAAAEVEPDEALKRQYREIAAGLPILRRGELVMQCEEFERYAELDFDALWPDRSRPLAAQVSQERLYRSRVLKQADVLLLMMLFEDEFSDAEVRAAWDYYLPYTSHDSSLSPGVHAIVAARLGLMEQAEAFWQQSLDIDVGNGAAEGIHIAAHGINWQIAVMGFGGLRSAMNADLLTLNPRLPANWTRLAFPVIWKGQRAWVDIRHESVAVRNDSAEPLAVVVRGQKEMIAPGDSQTFAVNV